MKYTNMELISVIIPIYKVEKELPRCIESILAQTYTEFEMILVDDGSPDRCGEICDRYAQEDTRIQVIHKKNGGVSEARNAGLDIAKGKYICCVDSDDFVHPQYLEILYNIMQKSGADVVVCDYETCYPGEEKEITQIDQMPAYEEIGEQHLYDIDFITSKRVKYVLAWNKLVKAELYQGIRYPVGKEHEDNYTTYKLLDKANKIVYTAQSLYYYVMRDQSITHTTGFSEKRFHIMLATGEEIEYFHAKGNQRMVELLTDSYLYWMWWCIDEMKKEGIQYTEKIRPFQKKFRKYLPYLKVSKSCSLKRICRYWYIAYLKRI